METKADLPEKTQFRRLLLLWIAVLLIPLFYSAYANAAAFAAGQTLPWAVIVSFRDISFFCDALSTAVLIYAAVRFRFRRCLWFILAAAVFRITYQILYLTFVRVAHPAGVRDTSAGDILLFFYLLLGLLAMAASVALTRLFAEHLRREWMAVLCALAAFTVLDLLTGTTRSAASYLTFMQGTQIGLMHSVLVQVRAGDLLRNGLGTAVGYGLIFWLFSGHKKETIQRATRFVRNEALRLWEATAK